jgi:predicted nucleic acid-binding protein
MGAKQVAADLALLRRRGILVPITATVQGVATHPEDDLVLATVVSAGAHYLVTGDTKLQDLGAFEGVTILSPRAFLERLTHDP